MPRHPALSAPAQAMPASIFARLVERLAGFDGEIVPFHIGDTHRLPPEAARLSAVAWDESPPARWYAYGPSAGDPALVAAVVSKLRARNGLDVGPAEVQITAGATHACSCAAQALLGHGDEVLALTPCWPLFRGHATAVGASLVEVPFSSRLVADPGADVAALVEPFIGPRTVAIYLINPGNPDGFVCTRAHLEQIAAVARRHDLWVLADEVYEDYVFDGGTHVSMASLPEMASRTVSVFSFSKAYAQAGLRVGYAVGPEPVIAAVKKLANHGIYSVPRCAQVAALAALAGGDAFLAETRAVYQAARDTTLAALAAAGIPTRRPGGGSYVFVDLTAVAPPGATSCLPVLERAAAKGVLLAPGAAFCSADGMWARLCYTAVQPDKLPAGLARFVAALRG